MSININFYKKYDFDGHYVLKHMSETNFSNKTLRLLNKAFGTRINTHTFYYLNNDIKSELLLQLSLWYNETDDDYLKRAYDDVKFYIECPHVKYLMVD